MVGNATDCQGHSIAAMLWRHGSAFDLNTLIAKSPLYLTDGVYVNGRGEIACAAVLPNGDERIALLVPAGLAAKQGLRTRVYGTSAPAMGRSTAPRLGLRVQGHSTLPARKDLRLGYHPG